MHVWLKRVEAQSQASSVNSWANLGDTTSCRRRTRSLLVARKVCCMGPLQPLLLGLFLILISPLWPRASTAVDVGGQSQLRVNGVALGDASTLMAEFFSNHWCRVAQVEFLDKFGVRHNKRRRPSSFHCVAFEGGDDTLGSVNALYKTNLWVPGKNTGRPHLRFYRDDPGHVLRTRFGMVPGLASSAEPRRLALPCRWRRHKQGLFSRAGSFRQFWHGEDSSKCIRPWRRSSFWPGLQSRGATCRRETFETCPLEIQQFLCDWPDLVSLSPSCSSLDWIG